MKPSQAIIELAGDLLFISMVGVVTTILGASPSKFPPAPGRGRGFQMVEAKDTEI